MSTDTTTSNPKKKRFKFKKRDLIFIAIGLLFAFVLRFVLINSHTVHHHANFALYVDEKRDEFDNFTFYEEISSCTTEDHSNPKTRVHMHGNLNSLVHVHDAGATWGHFFANLGYTLGDNILVRDSSVYVDGANGKKLSFILNGKKVTSIANETINSEDILLIDYGSADAATLQTRYDTVPTDADEFNSKPDPSSCSGGSKESLSDRFKRTLGLDSNEVSIFAKETEHHDHNE